MYERRRSFTIGDDLTEFKFLETDAENPEDTSTWRWEVIKADYTYNRSIGANMVLEDQVLDALISVDSACLMQGSSDVYHCHDAEVRAFHAAQDHRALVGQGGNATP